MDPVSLILTAISTGAAAAAKDTASEAIKDAYSGLKSLINKHLHGNQQATLALSAFEKDPETWQKPVEKTIGDTGAGADPEVVAAAQHLMQLVRPEQHAEGKFNIQTTGTIQGQQIGDFGQQQNVFGTVAPKS